MEACAKLGLDPKDLYFTEFNQFKKSNPEVFVLGKEIQKIRWNHLNQLKEKYIASIKQERKKIMENKNIDAKKEVSENMDRRNSKENFKVLNV